MFINIQVAINVHQLTDLTFQTHNKYCYDIIFAWHDHVGMSTRDYCVSGNIKRVNDKITIDCNISSLYWYAQ